MMQTRVIAHSIVGVLAATAALCGSVASVASAQGGRALVEVRDTTVTAAAAKRDTLESVVVRATRSPSAPGAARSTITRAQLQRRAAGQDAPLIVATTPSVTVYSDAGGYSGYSYIRLRGLDQTRLNITIDGVPLNDPEDQVLYFSNVPDFLGSIGSVDVGRGVGASTFGTASFAGSLNFQSVPLATTPQSAQAELSAGSFGTWRASLQGATGVGAKGLAAYGRFSRQGTSGYREHSGNDSWSGFGSVAWFRERDALKLTAFAGHSGTRLAYYAESEADLKVNRRQNSLSESEGDRFHQEMVSVQYARSLGAGFDATLMAYRNSAAGAYDVSFGAAPGGGLTLANYGLAHVWHGATAALTWAVADISIAAGATATDYHRDHWLAIRPTLTIRDYTNTGVKRDAAGFVKFAWASGPVRVAADLNLRHAAWRYRPSANAGIAVQELSWNFASPRAGITWAISSNTSLFASAGRTMREPARGDLLAGADDLNTGNVADLLPLSRVRPEQVDDLEAGATWRHDRATLTANLFDMQFRNEIAAIGALSLTGSPLRKNVPRSYRRGVELDGSYDFGPQGTLSANVAVLRAKIAEFVDDDAGVTYRNVEPLMSPPLIANLRWDVPLTGPWSASIAGRYVDRAHLANDGNASLVAPAYSLVDLALHWSRAGREIRVELNNALDANAFAGGYTDGTARYFYPIATRNILVTLRTPLGF